MHTLYGRHRTGSYSRWMTTIAVGVVLAVCSLTLVPAGWPQDAGTTPSQDTGQGTASGAGLQVASVAATVLYFPLKGAFAIVGAVSGGLAYVFSGLDTDVAKKVWVTSMYGTYIITPEHLTGDKPVRFLGVSEESKGPEPAQAAPAP